MSRKSLFLLSLAVIAAIAIYRWSGLSFDWSLFFSSLWNVHPGWFALSIAATLLSYVLRAIRWQVLLHPLKQVPLGALISTTVVGFSAIYVLGRAGELIRPLWLTRRERIPLTASVATIIVERFLDTLMVIALFGWALLFVDLPAATASTMTLMKNTAWLMVAGSVGAIVFMFFFRSNIERIVRFVPVAKLAALLRSFAEGLSFLHP
jgi:uncharacterized membrane protein YbhN (UPF0104 family)